MNKIKKGETTWKVKSLRTDYEWNGKLEVYWEIALDPLSDDYTPKEIDAKTLLLMWSDRVQKAYPNLLIPISWFVQCKAQGKFNFMPFQLNHYDTKENFLTFFSWPINSNTGERLNWLDLPVIDKLWNNKTATKGGFIQEATKWKPAIYQPYVYLPTLIKTTN